MSHVGRSRATCGRALPAAEAWAWSAGSDVNEPRSGGEPTATAQKAERGRRGRRRSRGRGSAGSSSVPRPGHPSSRRQRRRGSRSEPECGEPPPSPLRACRPSGTLRAMTSGFRAAGHRARERAHAGGEVPADHRREPDQSGDRLPVTPERAALPTRLRACNCARFVCAASSRFLSSSS